MSVDSQSILRNAEKYWLAAKSLDYINTLSRDDVQPYRLPETFDEVNVVQPKMVLELFAIELYLKALLAYRSGGYTKTHNLFELFSNLPKADRRSINECWKKSDKPYSTGLVGAATSRSALSPGEVLHEVRDYFRRWRYSFDEEEMKALYDRKQVVPEIFDVPETIREYIRSEIRNQEDT